MDPNKFIFPKFPIELRRDIWELARPQTRFIKMSASKDSRYLYSPAKLPNLLHACREPREIALKWHILSFAAKTDPKGTSAESHC